MSKNGNGGRRKPRFDRAFFLGHLRAQQLSQRQLAKLIRVDPGAISKIFGSKRGTTGKPRMLQLHEAQAIARVLKLQLPEVLKHAGVAVDLGDQIVDIRGTVSEYGLVSAGTPDTTNTRMISMPRDLYAGTFALLVRAPNNKLDKWVVLVSGLQENADECFGAHALCGLDDGKQVIGYIEDGYIEGTINVYQFITGETLLHENVRAHWARRVLWLKAPTLKRGAQ